MVERYGPRKACFWLEVIAAGALAIGCQTPAPAHPPGNRTHSDEPAPSRAEDGLYPSPQERGRQQQHLRQHYAKHEYRIPMRDGVHLFTAVYVPKDASQEYPILMWRTPYSIGPYGEDRYPRYPWYTGPSQRLAEEGYIFVYQDVRGRFMSEGEFVNVRPHISRKTSAGDIDESTDTYDTVEWLLANVPNHNGRVGMYGISYPGFYAAAGMIDAHPALKAVSPQAPIGDWFFDDFHHHGAFFLADSFNFFAAFGQPRPKPTTAWAGSFDHGTPDGYQFFLDLGPLRNANELYFHGGVPFWNHLVEHPNYDEFWQARNILPHLKDVAPAVMTVGGWFDAEDLYGPLHVYQAVEQQSPGIFNVLVMGPWSHGGWNHSEGEQVGNIDFDSKTALFYQEEIELAFFNHFLKDEGELRLPEAYVFETGVNRWRTFEHWPPPELQTRRLHLRAGNRLSFDAPHTEDEAYDQYVSDPAKPVPFTEDISTDVPKPYMTDDQRFAARRPDVLVYQTEPLAEAVTLAGPIHADLWVSTSGTASDWIVKLIDVFPPDAPDHKGLPPGRHMGGYQMMVRSEVFRGRFRDGYEQPKPFVPNEPTHVLFELQDVLHTFRKGRRIMVQIQSTWFPMVDRNPQKYVPNIFQAHDEDFIKTTQRVYHTPDHPSHLRVDILPGGER
jgi:putative CocE/NonD family hydrolase